MVFIGMRSIRFEISELSVEKSGWTTIFVDGAFATASDHNDGYSWSKPKKTIGGALAIAQPWTKIFVRSGEYRESLLIDTDHIILKGVIEDGPNVAKIIATGGAAIEISAGFADISGFAIDATNQHGIKATTPGHRLTNIVVDMKNTTGTNMNGIWLHESARTLVENCHVYGNYSDDVIGILLGENTVDAEIRENYISGHGSGMGSTCAGAGICAKTGYGIGIDDKAQRAKISSNLIIDNCVGVYLYNTLGNGFKGHSIIHNSFYENCNYDIYDQFDPDHPTTPSGITVRENFYGYAGWYNDDNRDGRANNVVNCNSNHDHAPLANPLGWKTTALPRSSIQ